MVVCFFLPVCFDIKDYLYENECRHARGEVTPEEELEL